MKQTYTFWFYGSEMVCEADSLRDAMAMANDHFEPLANDPDGQGSWKGRGPHQAFQNDRELSWY